MENTPQQKITPKASKPRRGNPAARKALAVTNNLPQKTSRDGGRKNFFKRKRRGNNRFQSAPKNPLAHKLVSNVNGLIGRSLKVIIPWIILSTAVFATGAYFVFNTAVAGRNFPMWYTVLLCIAIFGLYGMFGVIYGTVMALLYSVKLFSESFASIIKDTVQRIKNSIESRIDNISESLSRHDVAKVIKQTFGELSSNVRRYAARGAAGVITVTTLITVLFLARKAFLKSVSKIKNKAEFFALFSARVTLVLAVILNLTLFTRIALFAGYLIGLIAILSQVLAVSLLR